MTGPLLEISDLRVSFATPTGVVRAVDGVSLSVDRHERLGLAGESGSGKSVLSMAVLGLLRRARIDGSIRFDGRELVGAPEPELRALRARRIGYVFQDPLASLDPVRCVGDQVAEVLRLRGVSRRAAFAQAVDVLGQVGIPRPADRAKDYPHQFSGGMRQRVMIAIALVADPDLIIADEPTTALDVRVQAQVVDLLHDLADQRGAAVVLITHDLAVLAGFAQRVVVMNSGRVVEQGDVDTVYAIPREPYTRELLAALPRLDGPLPHRLAQLGGAR